MGGLEQLLIPILGDIYSWGKSYIHNLLKPGMYEVLNYESTLEIIDSKGKEATFLKTEEIKFLQNNIIAFQDQAWGDGKILLDYQCSPGVPVDFYRLGHKTYILISLRDLKQEDDRTKFNIQWKLKNGFLKSDGFWVTDINHSTQKIKTQIIFPKDRPPIKILLVESNHKRSMELPREILAQLPDKRWQVTWEKQNPRLLEHYILKWEW